jgi:hypothetical protein
MNTVASYIGSSLAALVLLVVPALASAQSSEVPSFQAYSGKSGFQDLQVGPASWYVAFHGTRMHPMSSVEAAWWARAAQLCQSANARYVVELDYVGDRALETDDVASAPDNSSMNMHRVAGVVYIPIITSSGPREFTPMVTPSKMGVIRCLPTLDRLRQGKVSKQVQDAINAGRKTGLVIPN